VKGKRVAIVNDVINAGSAVIGTFTGLQSIGANVVAIGALLALGDTIRAFAADKHLPLELLKHMPNNLWAPVNVRSAPPGNRSKLSAHPKGTCAVNRPASSTPVALIPAIRLCNDFALKTKRRI
jgi:hypothetical protein